MTQYSQKLIEHFTKNGRKPVFIEKSWEITPDTPIEDILYTYNEMPCRGYLVEEQGYFLENARHYSGRPVYQFLYPSVILDVPFEKHPYVIAMQEYIRSGREFNQEEMEKIAKLKDYE